MVMIKTEIDRDIYNRLVDYKNRYGLKNISEAITESLDELQRIEKQLDRIETAGYV